MKKQKKNNNQSTKGKNQQNQHEKQHDKSWKENQDGSELPNVEPDENTNF